MVKKIKTRIAVGDLIIGPYAKKLIARTLSKNRLTYGPLTARFESQFARLCGVRYALFTSSGTCALQVALHALKIIHKWQDGDEVIVPSVTFIATSNIVLHNNFRPVFVDIDPLTYNINTELIERAITKKTKCIIAVNLFSQPARMGAIMKIARRHNLKVLVDSCETMGVDYHFKPLGQWGDIVCFSTYASHLLVTGVGGFMTTNNSRYATMMRSLMNHGRDSIYYYIDQDNEAKTAKSFFKMVDRRFSFIEAGYSYRLTEMEAAIGLEGLKRLGEEIKTRRKNFKFLLENLKKFDKDLQLPRIENWEETSCMMFPIIIKKHSKIKREKIINFLETMGIETRYAMPLLNQPVYKKRIFGNIENNYPVAKWINRNGFYIGCHPYLSKNDLLFVVKAFEKFFALEKAII